LSAQNGEVKVAVSDTGPGIEPEAVERIFRPFWSGEGGGTALGVAIARELAFALGGRLELQSEPGRGSRFVLVLPTRVSQPAALRSSRGQETAPSRVNLLPCFSRLSSQ